jgi:hypothetical protein
MLKTSNTKKMAGWAAQSEGSVFKAQFHQEKKKKKTQNLKRSSAWLK